MTLGTVDSEARERLGIAEARIANLEKTLGRVDDNTRLIHKMNVLLEVQIESNKHNAKKMDAFESVINKVNDNLTNLNSNHQEIKEAINQIEYSQKALSEDLEDMEKTVETVKTSVAEQSNNGKLDVMKIITQDVPRLIIIGIVAAVLALIGLKI